MDAPFPETRVVWLRIGPAHGATRARLPASDGQIAWLRRVRVGRGVAMGRGVTVTTGRAF